MSKLKTQSVEQFLALGGTITKLYPSKYLKELKWNNGHKRTKKSKQGKQITLFKKAKKY